MASCLKGRILETKRIVCHVLWILLSMARQGEVRFYTTSRDRHC